MPGQFHTQGPILSQLITTIKQALTQIKPMRAAAGLTVAHLLFQLFFYFPVSFGPDANGYLIQARLLVDEGQTWFERESPLQFVSPHWLEIEPDRFYSRYPPGYSLIQAVVYAVGGIHATPLINIVFTSLSVLLVFLVGREWAGERWGLAAALLMAANPTANSWAMMGDTHPAIAFFLLAGLYCLLRWRRTSSMMFAALAGLCLGYIPTMHLAEALYSVGIVLFLLLTLRREPNKWPSALVCCVCAALPMIGLLAFNQAVFGDFWRNGYDLGFPLFSVHYFFNKLIPYFFLQAASGLYLFFLFGAIQLVRLVINQETRDIGITLLGIMVPVSLLYTSYFFFDGPMRFFLPLFYLYAILGVWLVNDLVKWHPSGVLPTAVILLFATLLAGLTMSSWRLAESSVSNRALHKISNDTIRFVEEGSAIISSTQVLQHLDTCGRWKLIDLIYVDKTMFPTPPMPGGPDGEFDGPKPLVVLHDMSVVDRYQTNDDGSMSNALLNDLIEWGGETEFYYIGAKEPIIEIVNKTTRVDYEMVHGFDFPEVQRQRPGVAPPLHPQRGQERPGSQPPRGPGGRQHRSMNFIYGPDDAILKIRIIN